MIDNLTKSADVPDDLFKQDSDSEKDNQIKPEDEESEEIILVSGVR